MDYEDIAYEVDDSILTITLDRPDQLNAFTVRMQHELVSALDQADADDEVRVVIVTGRGRGFCAGADLSMGAQTFDIEANVGDGAAVSSDAGSSDAVHRDEGGLLTLRIFDFTKPIIAAVNGAAVGVGVTMMLPMDIRLASESARFGFVFARRGIVPEACSSYFLPRLVGIDRALEWAYTGKVFDAAEALDGGLVREIVPADQLLDRAHEIAREIADNTSAVSVALTRQMMWKMLGASHPIEAHRVDSRGINALGASADAREGVVSFLEKRPAAFTDTVSADMPDFYPWWEPEEF
jgi:enoyl-CoA hydratase/carnithine racemase